MQTSIRYENLHPERYTGNPVVFSIGRTWEGLPIPASVCIYCDETRLVYTDLDALDQLIAALQDARDRLGAQPHHDPRSTECVDCVTEAATIDATRKLLTAAINDAAATETVGDR